METLASLIREGEHIRQDFKFRIDDSKKIARTLCAFANTEGGRLLIGVKDNGKVTGIDPSEEIHMVEAAAEMYCRPPLTFSSRVWQEEMRLVLEITVESSLLKPIMSPDEEGRWRAYVRREDHTLSANKILLGVWKQEKNAVSRPEKISDEAIGLLRIMNEFQPVTLSKIYRLSALDKKSTDRLLIAFIVWGLVKMNIRPEATFYSVTEIYP